LGDENNGVIAVQMLKDVSSSIFVDCGATIALGGGVRVGANGKAAPTGTTIVATAYTVGVDGSVITVYNK